MTGISKLNLTLLAGVIALALVAYFIPHKKESGHKLSITRATDAKSIRIEIAGSAPLLLERTAGEWKITAPVSARADSFHVQRLLEILDATSKDRFPATGLARYGLNEPNARVSINQQVFAFGAVNEMSREQYVLSQDGIYPLALRYGAALPKNALQLVARQLFAPEEAPVAFESGEFKLVQEDGKWQLTPPAADPSQDDINRWVDEWRLATALAVQAPSNRKPMATFKLKLKNGAEVSVAVLQREPQLVLARNDQAFEYQFVADAAKRLLAPPAGAIAPK